MKREAEAKAAGKAAGPKTAAAPPAKASEKATAKKAGAGGPPPKSAGPVYKPAGPVSVPPLPKKAMPVMPKAMPKSLQWLQANSTAVLEEVGPELEDIATAKLQALPAPKTSSAQAAKAYTAAIGRQSKAVPKGPA